MEMLRRMARRLDPSFDPPRTVMSQGDEIRYAVELPPPTPSKTDKAAQTIARETRPIRHVYIAHYVHQGCRADLFSLPESVGEDLAPGSS